MSDAFIEAGDPANSKLQTFKNTVSGEEVHSEAVTPTDKNGVPFEATNPLAINLNGANVEAPGTNITAAIYPAGSGVANALVVLPVDVNGNAPNVIATQADGLTNANNGMAVTAFGYVYNGATWDRARGNSTDGVTVNLGTNNDVTVKALDTITGLPSDLYTVDLGTYNSLPVTAVDLAGTAQTFQPTTGRTPIAEYLIAAKSVTATASGTTLIASPSVGTNAIRLWWYNLGANPDNGASVVAGLRWTTGGTDFFVTKLSQYGGQIAHSFKSGRSYIQGAAGEGLYVNLSATQTVYCNIDYEEITP